MPGLCWSELFRGFAIRSLARAGLLLLAAGIVADLISPAPAVATHPRRRPLPAKEMAIPSAAAQSRDAFTTRSERLPLAHVLTPRAGRRSGYRALADKTGLPVFSDIDLLDDAGNSLPSGTLNGTAPASAREAPAPSLATAVELRRLADLRGLTARTGMSASQAAGGHEGGRGGDRKGALAGGRDAPWSADHLLADATNMNDEYVSLQVCPTSGNLYAVFDAYDLGGTDRDIHIARSLDVGATWQVWEMPSFSDDEYHPELAIDGAGYLFVTWIRDDGVIIRSRSANPDDPLTWEWVRGLVVNEPCATPCIAVSGAGQYATVFIAASWLTINWDLYQYEYTLIWMYSTNGGDTVVYDYFLPDGYQDLWPDAELNGATAYLVNGEQDYYTGEIEILLAADAVSGGFVSPVYLTDWTNMSCGFPSLAAAGANVHCVYQLDYDDGLGNIDGDIIHCYSWDGVQTVYGPHEMVADEYESVGPAIFTRDGVVGCVWLDAPPNGDEFDLVTRLASLDGHPDFWGNIETITEQHYVEPTFRSAAGAIGSELLHAAWSDRRDFPTQGLNVYTSERPSAPNLSPYTPAGWAAPLVASMVAGERQNGPLGADRTSYISFAFTNTGLVDVTRDFYLELTVDGSPVATWILEGGLSLGTYVTVEDHEVVVGEGNHELGFRLDTRGEVAESDETDNNYTDDFLFIAGDPQLRLTPAMVQHIFPAPKAGRGWLQRLAANPPLRRQIQLPTIAPRLQAAMSDAAPEKLLRVVIEPSLRVDAPVLAAGLRDASLLERRQAVRTALAGQLERVSSALEPLMAELSRRGDMTPPVPLWLAGSLLARMTPAAVRELAARPEIGSLWLADARSESYGGSASAGGAAAAPPVLDPETAAALKALAWHLPRIGADQAWAQGYDGTGIIVGHTDSGVAYDHPDIAGHLWAGGPTYPHHGYDFLDEDDDPYDGDTQFWHGTHTAGLIVGDGTGGTNTGAAPGAQLMITRCVPGYYDDMVEALQFCLDHGANVISTSAGWGDPDDALREANRYNAEVLLAAGIPWICAAGNGDNQGGHYPVPRDISSPGDSPHPWYGSAGYSAVVTIGASTAGDQVWGDSSQGPTAWDISGTYGYDDYPYPPGLIKPDLVAPGENVTSTYGSAGYIAYSGTSMSTPLVAGAVAILLQANASLLPADLGQLLETTAVDIASAGRDNQAGAGLLDIPAALGALPSTDAEFFWVHNDGPLPLDVSDLSWSAAWLDVSPASAVVAAGDSVRYTAVFDPAGYGVGAYLDDVILTSDDPSSPHTLPVRMIIGDLTGIGEGGGDTPPPGLAALGNYPNPFNPRTVLQFTTAVAGRVDLAIFDLQGRLVLRLIGGFLPAGSHRQVWDGQDEAGRSVASGIYVARLAGPSDLRANHKLALLR